MNICFQHCSQKYPTIIKAPFVTVSSSYLDSHCWRKTNKIWVKRRHPDMPQQEQWGCEGNVKLRCNMHLCQIDRLLNVPTIRGRRVHMSHYNIPWISIVVCSTLKQTSVNSKVKKVHLKQRNDIVMKHNRNEDKWFPEKDWNVHIWVHAYDVSLFTVYKYVPTDISYFTKTPRLVVMLCQCHGGNCLTAAENWKVYFLWGERSEEGVGLSGFASWLASPRLSSFLEWSATYQPQAPRGHKPAPSPNLVWRWSRRTSLASCLLLKWQNRHSMSKAPSFVFFWHTN